MFQSHLIRRTFQIGACGAAIFLCAVPGQSEPEKAPKGDKAACKVAYKAAQEREQSSHLREAKVLYLACSKVVCGAFMRPECTTKYTQLNSDVPSVIPVVTDESGAAKTDVQVKMDGELLTSKLDGRALPVDPGMHEFTFSTETGVIATEKVMIVAGQRNSPVAVSLAKRGRTLAASVTLPAPAVGNRSALEPRTTSAKPATEKASPPTMASEKDSPVEEATDMAPEPRRKGGGPGVLPYIVGGVGLAAVGAGALVTLWGKKDNDALGQCSPNCPLDSLDHVKRMYTIADISIGVGVAALAGSAILFATSGSSTKEKTPVKSASYSVDVQPTRNGAFATVSGQF
jgi:hypothetical protein